MSNYQQTPTNILARKNRQNHFPDAMNSEPDAEIIASEDKKTNAQYKDFIAQKAEASKEPVVVNNTQNYQTMQNAQCNNS